MNLYTVREEDFERDPVLLVCDNLEQCEKKATKEFDITDTSFKVSDI